MLKIYPYFQVLNYIIYEIESAKSTDLIYFERV